jgi:hypothetical protein
MRAEENLCLCRTLAIVAKLGGIQPAMTRTGKPMALHATHRVSFASARRWSAIACLAMLGCTGRIGSAAQPGGAAGSPSIPNAAAGSSGTPAVPDMPGDDPSMKAPVWPRSGLRRLTVSEYRATVRDLLGVDTFESASFQPDTPLNGFVSIGATAVAYPAQQIEQLEQAAFDAAQKVFDDTALRSALVGCEPGSPEDPCVRDFLSRFALRAFRRPATAVELDPYAGLVTSVAAGADVWSGLAYAVAAFLQSPHVLYRVELGEPQGAAEGPRRLTAFEVATRLSYLVTGSTPDDELLAAAGSGQLDGQEGLRSSLERLLTSPRAEATLMRFFEEQLEIDHVSKINKVPDTFPAFTPALAEAMQREMHDVVRDVAFRSSGDLLALLTRRDTYVDAALAALYGLPAPASQDSWQPVTLPEDGPRAGLLGLAGFLALHAAPAETSATKRGFFVVSKLLCRTVPPPPPSVITTLPEPAAGENITMRERVGRHMSDDSCRACHGGMDPFGLALEHFDALGTYRDTDDGLAIDARGELDQQAFDGARELGALLGGHPDVAKCFARRFYEFALGTQAKAGEPVPDLVAAFELSGRRFPELVRALVLHDVFRFTSAPR